MLLIYEGILTVTPIEETDLELWVDLALAQMSSSNLDWYPTNAWYVNRTKMNAISADELNVRGMSAFVRGKNRFVVVNIDYFDKHSKYS